LLGIKAISAQNGWEYALLGVCIVFSGLILLSFVLSQLHKLLSLWENRSSIGQQLKDRLKKEAPFEETEDKKPELSSDLLESKLHFQMLVERIGYPFALPKLLRLAEKSGLQRPHATINELLKAGIILPDKNGYFTWKQ
jgi:hypothetical protein